MELLSGPQQHAVEAVRRRRGMSLADAQAHVVAKQAEAFDCTYMGCVPVASASLKPALWGMFGEQIVGEAVGKLKKRAASKKQAPSKALLYVSLLGLHLENREHGDTIEDEPLSAVVHICVLPESRRRLAYVADYMRLGLLFCHILEFPAKADAGAARDVFAKVRWRRRDTIPGPGHGPGSDACFLGLVGDDGYADTEYGQVNAKIGEIMGSTLGVSEVGYLGFVPVRHWIRGDGKAIPPVVRPEVVVTCVTQLLDEAALRVPKVRRRMSLGRKPSTTSRTGRPPAGTPVVLVLSAEGLRAVASETREELLRSFIGDIAYFTEASSESEHDKDLFVYVNTDQRVNRAQCHVFQCGGDQASELCDKLTRAIKASVEVDELRRGSPFTPTATLKEDVETPLAELEVNREGIKPVSQIGAGKFGVVFMALAKLADGAEAEQVAIKILRNGAEMDDMADFLREAEVMRALTHPNIVALRGVGWQHRPWLIVEELCDFGDLDEVLRACQDLGVATTLFEKLALVVQMARGLEYMHSKGYLHGDLAARNCLMHLDNVVKIADFGASRRLEAGSQAIQVDVLKVSPRWLSPEICVSQQMTEKSDVWALGITVWEVFSYAQTPFESCHFLQVPRRVAEGLRPGQPTEMPDETHGLLLKILSKEAKARPTCTELVRAFDELLAGTEHPSDPRDLGLHLLTLNKSDA